MSWSATDLLDALAAAGDDGLSHEDAERALGADPDVNPRDQTAVKDALAALAERHVIAEPVTGVYLLVASASERGSGAAAAADPAASAGLGGPAVSLSGDSRLFGGDVPSAYRDVA